MFLFYTFTTWGEPGEWKENRDQPYNDLFFLLCYDGVPETASRIRITKCLPQSFTRLSAHCLVQWKSPINKGNRERHKINSNKLAQWIFVPAERSEHLSDWEKQVLVVISGWTKHWQTGKLTVHENEKLLSIVGMTLLVWKMLKRRYGLCL